MRLLQGRRRQDDAGRVRAAREALGHVRHPRGFLSSTQLPEDFEHFEPILEHGHRRMPMFETAGIHTFFNGPESFTPDDRYYLGEAPELAATGSRPATTPSASFPPAARAWRWRNGSNDGEPPFDLWEVDIRRAQPFQRNRRYLKERVTETLGLLYADHWPYRQVETARGVRRSRCTNT
jgi:hypothetical protein